LRISIITVVYNNEATISRTIESIISQKYIDLEYIIIDGGSTDDTLIRINKYEKYITHLVSEPDTGIYNAMNKGIKKATGELIGTLNSDDWLEPDSLNIIANAATNNPSYDIYHSDIYFYNGLGKRLAKPHFNKNFSFSRGMPFFHPTFYVRKEIYKILVYDEKYRILADFKFTMMCLLNGYMFYYINKPLVSFSLGGVSSSIRQRILEGQAVRIELGYNRLLVYCNTIYRGLLAVGGLIKQNLFRWVK
jgi:glycosyltransferase involved in cell wall biosynthesis